MITVVGSYGAGLTMRTKQMPVAGETLSGGVFSASHGGKGSNQAVAAARLGSRVSFLSAIGDDSFGRDAQELWRAEGIDASCVLQTDAATMVGVIFVEEDGENRIVIAPGALDELRPEHIGDFEAEITESDLIVVSMEIPLPVALEALRVGRERGTQTLLNPAPAQRLPDEAWEWIDILTPNASEARSLLGMSPLAEVADDTLLDQLRKKYPGIIVMTLGGQGVIVDDGSKRFRIPPIPVKQVVDTTGAGDAFTGSLAHCLDQGYTLEDSVRVAAAAGAYSVGLEEVIPSIPTSQELKQFIENQDSQHAPR